MAVTQAVLPQFRQRQAGVIVNVTSSVTLTHPLLSVYTASTAAVTAFTECLALELQQLNVRVSLAIPGRVPDTRFSENAQSRMQGGLSEAYSDFTQGVIAKMRQSTATTRPEDVAEAVWRAATDASSPVRIAAGSDAVALAGSC